MAAKLKRQYDLLSLKVAMDLSEENPRVKLELRKGQLDPIDTWLCSAEDIGLPEKLNRSEAAYRGYPFRLPVPLLDKLKADIEPGEYRDRPLWLHLAKPLGYLNLVPWEQLLVPQLGVPVLRLPDFLAKPPRESLNSFDAILCSSLPVAKDSFMAVEHLERMAHHILAAGPSRTTIHVFTDIQIHDEVVNRLAAMPNVRVYNPAEAHALPTEIATTRIVERSSRIESPWLVWMRDALKGRSVDVTHFLAHGYLSRDQGALAFAESPTENEDRRVARFVGASELLAFLTQIGAWSAAFSSPEHNYSEMGLRLLADTMAQLRPGPVLHHEVRMDPDCTAMAAAYRFLFGRENVKPPASPSIFMYCHPSKLAPQPEAPEGLEAGGGLETVKALDSISTLYQTAENVPAWIAATERYVEQAKLESDRLREQEEVPTSTRARQQRGHDAKLIEDTVRQIQETLARAASGTKGGEGDG